MSMFKSKSVTSKVGDQDVEFFSLSFPVLFALKSAVGPISKLLSSFFRSTRHDVGRFEEHTRDKDGAPVKVIQQQAISPEMAKLRAEQSAKAMQEALDGLFADQNRLLIGRILMDSLRGMQPRKPTPEQIENFLAELDLGQVVELLQGVAKANAEVFGPLVQGWVSKLQSQLHAQASSVLPTSPEPDSGSENSAQAQPSAPRLVPKG
jgi:hypothetical protein